MKTKNNKNNKHGLILLVVLGMLTLFSLLTVTFVLVSSQSRSTNVAFSRRMVRETETRPMFNDAVHQLLRGTTDPNSAMFGQDLLADLYGANEASTLSSQMLSIRRNGMTWFPDNLQRPMLLGGSTATGVRRFLKIPIDRASATGVLATLLDENDALTGRLITFPEGQGPLGGESFRVIRHVGDMTAGINPQHVRESSFSITIDLNEANLGREYTRTTPGSGATETLTLAEWADKYPAAPQTAPVPGNWASGIYLCYNEIYTDSSRILGSPYQFYINAMPLNSHGIGVQADGSTQIHTLFTGTPPGNHTISAEINQIASSFQPGLRGVTFAGDTDEPIDAADYNNMFLAFRDDSGEIIPSFHRAELINYIVNFKPLAEYSEWDFWATIRRIELATMRPLSLNITTPSGSPSFMNASGSYVRNSQFNSGDIGTLTINVTGSADQWATNWPAEGMPAFIEWLNRLTGRSPLVGGGTRMTWDVDNLGTGVPDSIWMDLGLPLQRTADGKLLKSLVAYYIEDLDGKLDINATGSVAQANMPNLGYFAQPTKIIRSPDSPDEGRQFALGPGTNIYLNQGLGYGSADISFRHLLGRGGLVFRYPDGTIGNGQNHAERQAFAEKAFREIMIARYQPNPSYTTYRPGSELGHDAISQLNLRETRAVHRHDSLPGLPMGVRGRLSLTLDRLGNPILHNYDDVITPELTEYAARLVSAPHQDSPFTLAEWERIYRSFDSDYSELPDRLERLFGETAQTLPSSRLRHEITPISRSLRVPLLGGRSSVPNAGNPQSFFQLINSVRTLRNAPTISQGVYAQLFPLEFHRAARMNLNRAFGNGFDDDTVGFPGYGEIDEPLEIARGFVTSNPNYESAIQPSGPKDIQRNGPKSDTLAGGDINDPSIDMAIPPPLYKGQEGRQLFARHLYCLAQLLIPEDYQFPNIERDYWKNVLSAKDGGDRTKYDEIRGRILAQWAVNIVDFRDADAAMTRFPYDETPFDGWAPGKVVWGMEQPELLLTESLAFHDLRIRKDPVASNPERFDQFRIPQGSLFLELYCPRTTDDGPTAANSMQFPGVPTSLYRTTRNSPPIPGDVHLDVGRLTPASIPELDSGLTQYPVWRVYIGKPANPPGDKPTLKTPNERLIAPSATNVASPTRFDLTYQIPITDPPNQAGLVFDHSTDNTERLNPPNPDHARVIVFTPGFVPDNNNCPGVSDPVSQVFTNRSASPFLRGNQYLVVGPRDVTYLGSRAEAKAMQPLNRPNHHRIAIRSEWAALYREDGSANGTEYRSVAVGDQFGQNVRAAVTMIAAANLPDTWTSGDTLTEIGVNVSEPLPKPADYYPEPTARVSTANNSGFDSIPRDGYHDYSQGNAPPRAPSDQGVSGSLIAETSRPLQQWDPDKNGDCDVISEASDVVRPGTSLDWCTAFLQRLADPSRPWHATFNPYITVDWIPIDLTVFSGEEDDPVVAPSGNLRLASRQKSGQPINSTTLAFEPGRKPAINGQTFLSALTHAPRETTNESGSPNLLKVQIPGDRFTSGKGLPRPSTCDNNYFGDRTSAQGRLAAFTTLGFLNSPFVLAAETLHSNPMPPRDTMLRYYGGPADPSNPDPVNQQWHPATLFWPNRQYVNRFELTYVPVSSPGQLGQEFSATEVSGGPFSRAFESAFNGSDNARPTSPPVASANTNAQYPFGHLLNFFQEMPELTNPVIIGGGPRRSKDTCPAMLLEMVETPSPWADVEGHVSPGQFASIIPSNVPSEWSDLARVHNFIMAPLRAPFNKLPLHAEPGKVNLNTVSSPEVLQGLVSNMLVPSDIDGLIDHNADGVRQAGARAEPGQAATLWTSFKNSRMGYAIGGGGNYVPVNGGDRGFDPRFPTRFAGAFKPIWEAGMVPKTRVPNGSSDPIEQQYGVLDYHSRMRPGYATVMRPQDPLAANLEPLFNDTRTYSQRHPVNDLYPISRLQNLVTERSNVFAVYATVGLFEYDEANNSIGAEYGRETGENKRLKSFYVIDRSIPVAYRPGEDTNVEKLILIKRILSE